MADLTQLSDAELSQMLKNYGVNVGPINVATRRTYERRIAKLQAEEPTPPSQLSKDVDQGVDEETKSYTAPALMHRNEVNASSVEQEVSIYTADVATSPYHQSEDENENFNRVVVKEKYKEQSVKKTIVTTPSRHLPENDEEVIFRERHEERSVKPAAVTTQIFRERHEERPVKPAAVTTPSRHWPENNKEEIQVRQPEPNIRPMPVLSKIPQPVIREREFSSRIESRPSLPLNRRTPVPRSTPVISYTTTPSRPVLTKLSQEKKKEYPVWLPVWLPVLIIGIAVILGYLIYANMEPAAKSNIPGEV